MTALNIAFGEKEVLVVSDTLVVAAATKQPYFFTTKVFAVPHLEGLICGTGIHSFIRDWGLLGGTQALVSDIRHLDFHTPDALKKAFEAYKDVPDARDVTSTIYQIGYDREERRFVGFVYRSTDDFRSEAMDYSYRIKPPHPFATPTSLPQDFIRLAEEQQAADRAKEAADSVGIGGELIAFHLTVDESDAAHRVVHTNIWKCHEFGNFAEDCSQAVSNWAASRELADS